MSHQNPATPAMYAHQIFKAFPHKPHANTESTPNHTNLGELDKAFNSFVDEMVNELVKLTLPTTQNDKEVLCYVRCSRFYFNNLVQSIQGVDILITSVDNLIATLKNLFEIHKNDLADTNNILEFNVGFQQKQNGNLIDVKGFKFVAYQLKN